MERLFTFMGGASGKWRVLATEAVVGEGLPAVARLDVKGGLAAADAPGAVWRLKGVTSNERYVTRAEREVLVSKQPGLGRPEATCAALIPIRKSSAWWALAQDERREILEARSAHIQIGLGYLPAVARRLHHCRDLGEPFDFVTWFEFAEEHSKAFDELLAKLRATEEWNYVDREVEIRLVRDAEG